jgi:excisionase family DNA binding protein
MELCGYKEAAKFLGVPLGTLYAWVHQKRVPHVRFGARAVRFDRQALRAWIDRKTIATQSQRPACETGRT